MSKVAHYLQEHLLGEVTASADVRRHFAHDASILHLAPAIVVYPRNETDVRKTARFAWQLAERGRRLAITARGGGSDTSGAALGRGIMLVFTAHMNRILTMDSKKEFITLEPGVTYEKLLQTLYTHGLFLPPYPGSKHFATIGGSIANNAIGEKSVKYGSTGDYVEELRVVLANGEIIETGAQNKRELNRKLGLSSMEGQVYRDLDVLLEENAELIDSHKSRLKAVRNAVGYNIFDVKGKDGFDLTPLFVGSQGTLGIITEATLTVIAHNPTIKSVLISLDDINDLTDILPKILRLKPSVLDMMNRAVIQQVSRINPNQLNGLMERPAAAIHLFVEFDDQKEAIRKKSLKKLAGIVAKAGGSYQAAKTPEEQDKIRKVRESIATLLTQPHGQAKAVPIAEDIAVPISELANFLDKAAQIYAANGLVAAAWGHAGEGIVRMSPFLDLAQVGDRQKLFKLAGALYKTALEMGGSISAAAGDGRVRAPYSANVFGKELHQLMLKVKKIFDPHGILNPGVKTANQDDVRAMMRGDYSLSHHHEYLPRS
jgi:FAD/FMN-containing dehydrogenase